MQARLTFTAGTGWDKSGHAIAELPVAIMTIRAMMAQAFGGYTETSIMGGFVNWKGELVQEPGKQWTIVTIADSLGALRAEAERIAGEIATALNQESVLLQMEQIAFVFIEQPVTIKAQAEKEKQS